MVTQIQLDSAQRSDIEVIRDLRPERIENLIERIEEEDPAPLTSAELGLIFNDVFDGDEETAGCLLRQVLSWASIESQCGLKAVDVLGGLLNGVRSSERPWTSDEFKQWNDLGPKLQRLLEQPRIWTVANALTSSYDFAYLLQEARIVSDIRPVFDRDATRVEAAVISFTLRLRYDGLDGNQGISIAMNQADVEALLDECQRARRKARILAKVMNQNAGVRTVITGCDDQSGEE